MGVILLMYSIGLEFSFRDLLDVKWVAILGGPLGILLSVGVALLVGWLLGWSPTQSIAVGTIVSSLAQWCSPDYWRIAENCARLMAE
jgi:monovalent cation:H+ antiporter-2, CPA2 family